MDNYQRNGSKRTGTPIAVIQPDQGGARTERREDLRGKQSTYYNMPLVKKAHWGWEIILYFFLGGIAGGSFLVSTLEDLFNPRGDKSLIRAGRYLSFACILASPILLIMDLGRPERFHHMLRIFKLRSAMSLGTWGLTLFGLFCGFTTAYQMAKDELLNWFPFAARVFRSIPIKVVESLGAFFGLFVASYTGVLLSSTAIPLWARARHILGPLFLTSGISTGLSALSLLLSFGRPRHDTLERLDQAEMIAMTTELALIASVVPLTGRLSKPLFRGTLGFTFITGTIGAGLVLPLLLKLGWKLSGRGTSRSLATSTSTLALLGGIILRTVWVLVGRTSANNPQDTHFYNALEWEERKKL
jgi:formate-dependent nitrite reductase membrane component NrfD